MMSESGVVYWLTDERCVCPWRHGYVGISRRWPNRLKQHSSGIGKQHPNFKAQVLFTGTWEECLAVERSLRPDYHIGWNQRDGGSSGTAPLREQEPTATLRFGAPAEWFERLDRWCQQIADEKHMRLVPGRPAAIR
jgi:hypothetical protein